MNISDYRDKLVKKSMVFYRDNPDVTGGCLLDKQIKFLKELKKDLETCKKELTTTKLAKREYKELYNVIYNAIKFYERVKKEKSNNIRNMYRLIKSRIRGKLL